MSYSWRSVRWLSGEEAYGITTEDQYDEMGGERESESEREGEREG